MFRNVQQLPYNIYFNQLDLVPWKDPAIVMLLIIINILGGAHNTINSFNFMQSCEVDIREITHAFRNSLFMLFTRNQHEYKTNKFDRIDFVTNAKNLSVAAQFTNATYMSNDYKIVILQPGSQTEYLSFSNEELYTFIIQGVRFLRSSDLVEG